MALIDSSTSREEQAIRSIRSSEPALSLVVHQPHQYETPEERLLDELERFRVQALQSLLQSFDEVIVNVVKAVLARDRQVVPAEIRELVQRELRRCERESPVRLRVAASDIASVRANLPIVADSNLLSGGLVLEMRDGETVQRLPVQVSCSMSRKQSHIRLR